MFLFLCLDSQGRIGWHDLILAAERAQAVGGTTSVVIFRDGTKEGGWIVMDRQTLLCVTYCKPV